MSVQPLALRHDGIELPLCFALSEATASDACLSESEGERYRSYQFAAKKEGFLLGRLAAKRALGALLGEPDLRGIEIGAGIFGQPLVRHARAGSTEVTLSHSHGLAAALAFPAGYPMGIDLETVSAISAGTIIGALEASPAEQDWLAASGLPEAAACAVLWTAREALGKALKIGINGPLRILSLAEIRASGAATGGERAWVGRYLNFPGCQCLSQAHGDRVLSLAMPRDAELGSRPRLPG